MNASLDPNAATPLVLHAETAADLMTPNPASIRRDATIREAAAFLIERDISAAAVIDEAGRPVGVLSRSDIVRHQGGTTASVSHSPDFYQVADLLLPPAYKEILQIQRAENTQVREIMTSTIISVAPDDPVVTVVGELVAIRVHRLFVIDRAGVLVGVISAFDVLRKLHK